MFDEHGQLQRFVGVRQDIQESQEFAQLQVANEKLAQTQAAMDSFADAIVWVTSTGRFVYANGVMCRKRGYTQSEMLELSVHDLDPAVPTREFFVENIWPSVLSATVENPLVMQQFHRRKDQTEFPVEIIAFPFEIDGETVAIVSARDTTERVRDREALVDAKMAAEESEQRFRALADSASPLAWTTELDSTCSWLNKRWLEYSGTTLESQLDYGWVETVRGYVGMSFDSHETRLARQALEASEAALKETLRELAAKEQRLNLAVTGTTDALWDWDTETDAVWYAPRFLEMLGYDPSGDDRFPPVLDSFANSVHPDDREHTWAEIEDHFQNQRPYDVRYRLRRVDGSYIWCRARGKAIRNEDGKPIRMSGSVQNISDLIAAELKTNLNLKRSNEELEQFAYVASHDLRSPLRAVTNIVSFLRTDEADSLSESSEKYLAEMEIRVVQMEKLLDDLLDYSRVGKISHGALKETDVEEIVREAIQLTDVPHGLQIVMSALPRITTYPVPLRQVFLNLIGNAVKYHDKPNEHGRIEISSHDKGGFYEFHVTDNGPGIDEKYHQKIFGMFQRLESQKEIKGSGVGLPLIRKIIQGFGGEISMQSTPGSGSTFTFTWPKHAAKGITP